MQDQLRGIDKELHGVMKDKIDASGEGKKEESKMGSDAWFAGVKNDARKSWHFTWMSMLLAVFSVSSYYCAYCDCLYRCCHRCYLERAVVIL